VFSFIDRPVGNSQFPPSPLYSGSPAYRGQGRNLPQAENEIEIYFTVVFGGDAKAARNACA
jgi:hypothetical protein